MGSSRTMYRACYPLLVGIAGLLVFAAMGAAMYELFAVIERRSTGWAHRGPSAAG